MKPVAHLSDEEFEQLVHRAAALPDAPEAWVQRAIAVFAPAAPSASPGEVVRAAWRLVRAALSFDSWAAAPALAGVRGLPSDVRHLLFSAEGRDVDLRIAPAAQDFALVGQILGPDEAGLVELAPSAAASASGPARTTTLDELGEFRIDGVQRGTYRLTLRVGGDAIELPPITVGDTPR